MTTAATKQPSFWLETLDPFARGFFPQPECALTHYSLAFVMDPAESRVALIEKQRPAFLRGKWNGIGGKLEQTDPDIEHGASRELYEEAGLLIDPRRFCKFALIGGESYVVHAFSVLADASELGSVWAQTDEDVGVFLYSDLLKLNVDQDARYLFELAKISLKGERVEAVIRR